VDHSPQSPRWYPNFERCTPILSNVHQQLYIYVYTHIYICIYINVYSYTTDSGPFSAVSSVIRPFLAMYTNRGSTKAAVFPEPACACVRQQIQSYIYFRTYLYRISHIFVCGISVFHIVRLSYVRTWVFVQVIANMRESNTIYI